MDNSYLEVSQIANDWWRQSAEKEGTCTIYRNFKILRWWVFVIFGNLNCIWTISIECRWLRPLAKLHELSRDDVNLDIDLTNSIGKILTKLKSNKTRSVSNYASCLAKRWRSLFISFTTAEYIYFLFITCSVQGGYIWKYFF